MESPLDVKLGTVLGGRTAGALEKGLGLVTVADLLGHYPRRYAHRGELTELTRLPVDENVTIVAEVVESRDRPMRQKRGSILEVRISDGKGILSLTFFNQAWRAKELHPGVRGIFAGKVTDYRGSLQLAHPDYELFPPVAEGDAQAAGDEESVRAWAMLPIPIYPATSTIASWQLQKSIAVVLDTLPELPDPVPEELRASRSLLPYAKALELIHRPQVDADWGAARKSLRFQEAFLLQAALLQQRARLRRQAATPRVPKPGGYLERFDAALAFERTGDQVTVGEEIAADIAATTPMNRLVQGEVGSGKTLVALRAMLAVADSGGQSALLAPTEVLAGQHLRSIAKTLGPDLSAAIRPTHLAQRGFQVGLAETGRPQLASIEQPEEFRLSLAEVQLTDQPDAQFSVLRRGARADRRQGSIFAVLSESDDELIDRLARRRTSFDLAVAFVVHPRTPRQMATLSRAGWVCVRVEPQDGVQEAWVAAGAEQESARAGT